MLLDIDTVHDLPRSARVSPSEIVVSADWRERAVALLDPEVTFQSALAWVYTRDAVFAAEVADMPSRRLTITLAAQCQPRPGADGAPTGLPSYVASEREADATLLKACGEGSIVAFGRVGSAQPPESRIEPIPRHEWSSLDAGWHGERRVMRPKAPQAHGWWWDVRFSRDGLLAAFPPHGTSAPVDEPQGDKPPAEPVKDRQTPLKRRRVLDAFAALWPDGQTPPTIKERNSEIRAWFEKRKWLPPDDRTIRRALAQRDRTGQ